jgi:hypothetical protein
VKGRLPLWVKILTGLALVIGGLRFLTGDPLGGAIAVVPVLAALLFHTARRGRGGDSAVAGWSIDPGRAALGSLTLAACFLLPAVVSFQAGSWGLGVFWSAIAIFLAYLGFRTAQLAAGLRRVAGSASRVVSYGREPGPGGFLRPGVIVAALDRELVITEAAFRQKPERRLPYADIVELRVEGAEGREVMTIVADGREQRLVAMPSESLADLRRVIEAGTA